MKSYYKKSSPSCLEVSLVIIVLFLLVIPLLLWISSLVLGFAWNLVMPSAFGLPELDGIQAFGLTLLLWIIGGAFRSATSHSKD